MRVSFYDADFLSLLANALTIVLGVCGFMTATHSDWVQRHRWATLIGFTVLVIATTVVINQTDSLSDAVTEAARISAARANAQLGERMQAITDSTTEIARLANLNSELQARLLEQTKDTATLAKKTVNEITGGDSFAYLDFSFQFGPPIPDVTNVGKSALPKLSIRAVDLSKQIDRTNNIIWEIDSLGPGHSRLADFAIEFNSTDFKAFNVFFTTNYSQWSQHLLLAKIDGQWERAFAVGRGTKRNDRTLMRCVTPRFPKQRLTREYVWEPLLRCPWDK